MLAVLLVNNNFTGPHATESDMLNIGFGFGIYFTKTVSVEDPHELETVKLKR